MRPFQSTDNIYATFHTAGKILASFQLSGVNSISDIMKVYGEQDDTAKGLISLTLRNSTQGWSQTTAVVI